MPSVEAVRDGESAPVEGEEEEEEGEEEGEEEVSGVVVVVSSEG